MNALEYIMSWWVGKFFTPEIIHINYFVFESMIDIKRDISNSKKFVNRDVIVKNSPKKWQNT